MPLNDAANRRIASHALVAKERPQGVVLSEYFWKDEARVRDRLATEPIEHLGQPEEIAEIAVMLAGDKASYLTGQVIKVDGGATVETA